MYSITITTIAIIIINIISSTTITIINVKISHHIIIITDIIICY